MAKTVVLQQKPSIAIIIPCYNYDKYVGRAINSVLPQKSSSTEIVVVDDGSTDNSWEVIRKFDVNSFRLDNRGARSACLYALQKTSAPFVLFLDADDELKPGSIAKILNLLDNDVAKLQFSLTCVDKDGSIIRRGYPDLKAFRERAKIVREIVTTGSYQSSPTSGNVFRRDVCELLHEACYENSVDGITLLAAPFMGDIISINEDLGIYRVHGMNDSGLGRSPSASVFERDLKRYESRIDHLNMILARKGDKVKPINAQSSYYYLINKLYASVCLGEKLSITSFFRIMRVLSKGPESPQWKAISAVFLLMLFVLPNNRARAILKVRLSIADRSKRKILQAALFG